ncbi:putative movement protein [Spinach latent virus]|uniref:Movement protein n=1 Tax=Spinach latent virus TaxID=42680 RepID=O57164_9BROM|nr:putative movement protein [Spinach latent virus]AAB99736.1 putative movement protein [Spinach latent virus]
MALVKTKPLVLTAANEEQLYKQISGALESVNKNMKMFRACVPLELKNNGYTSFELCDGDTRSLVTAFNVRVQKNLNVDHPHIFLLWVPRILKSTTATAIIKCKYLATGDEKAVGKFPLNEAFIFAFGWERSIRMKDAYDGKGLHLFIQCFAPNSEAKAPLGRLVPMWDNCATAKMRYTEDVGSSLTTADEMRVRNVLTDKDTRNLLRSYMATDSLVKSKKISSQVHLGCNCLMIYPLRWILRSVKCLFSVVYRMLPFLMVQLLVEMVRWEIAMSRPQPQNAP